LTPSFVENTDERRA